MHTGITGTTCTFFYNSKTTLSLNQISEDKINTMLMELESHKETGLDGLQAKLLIDSAKSIFLKHLSHIINMSIISGVFPRYMKKLKLFQFIRKENLVIIVLVLS